MNPVWSKKPDIALWQELRTSPPSNFRLADEALHHAYSTPIEDSNGGG
jgi:hypothetical protein